MKTFKPLLLLFLVQYEILSNSCQENQTIVPVGTPTGMSQKSIKANPHTPNNASSYPMPQDSSSGCNRPLSKEKPSDNWMSSTTFDIVIICIVAGVLAIGVNCL